MSDNYVPGQTGIAAAANVKAAVKPDRPWLFRTYSGHSSAAESNALYRANLERGQTGL